MKKILQLILISIFIFNIQSIDGQILKKLKDELKSTEKVIEEDEIKHPNQKQDNAVEQTNTLSINEKVFKAPNQNLENITLQSHKNLPRVDKRFLSTISRELYKYNLLLEMKFLSEYYDKMNTETLLSIKYDKVYKIPKEDIKSAIAQNYMRRIAFNFIKIEHFEKFFCIPEQTCKRDKHNKNTKFKWGGIRADEFDQMSRFKLFIKNNYFSDLKRWAKEIDDEVYMVQLQKIGSYDFKKGEFPITVSLPNGYVPVDDAGNDLDIRSGTEPIIALIKMKENEAEEFILRNSKKKYHLKNKVFVVSKIKYFDVHKVRLSHRGYEPIVKFFYINNPVIEFYEDEALTKKIGDVNINK